jgi:hypothetical protein
MKKLDERQWVSRGETLAQGMDRDRCLSSVDLTRLAECQWLNMPPPAARALMLHCKRQKSWFAAHLRALFLGGVPVPLTHTHGFWALPISTPNRRLIVLAAHTGFLPNLASGASPQTRCEEKPLMEIYIYAYIWRKNVSESAPLSLTHYLNFFAHLVVKWFWLLAREASALFALLAMKIPDWITKGVCWVVD